MYFPFSLTPYVQSDKYVASQHKKGKDIVQ
jgi:hypothetical protein